MDIFVIIVTILVALYFVGGIIENHLWNKSRAHIPDATEEDLIKVLKQLKSAEGSGDVTPFERNLIKRAFEQDKPK